MESRAGDEGLELEAILKVTKEAYVICTYKTVVACGLWVGNPCLFLRAPMDIKGRTV